MRKKQNRIQLALISIGFLLFVLTYFYYPSLNKDKIEKNDTLTNNIKDDVVSKDKTSFVNLEYKGLYDLDKPFKIKSKEAYILNDEPDVVYMKSMHVLLYLDDNRTVEITSLKGRYNKVTYDCFFEENVRATDNETIITASNLDLLATENFVKIYNEVRLDYTTGSLKADKVDYDFETKHFKVSMFDDSSIKMKVIQWTIQRNLES